VTAQAEHRHPNGFEHLDVEVEGLSHDFHLGWKLTAATDGPPGYPGEPYVPLAVSFTMTKDERRTHGHLDYALSRSSWQNPAAATEEDGEILVRLVLERLPADLRELDAGRDPEALRINRTPKFLRP
jgi:hypothetical protein